MKRDPHLLISDVPLKEGQDYTALCGKKITKAAWVFMWDPNPLGGDRTFCYDQTRVCKKCGDREPARHVYLYGAIDGELSIKEEL